MYPVFSSDLHRRKLPILDHLSDLLAGGLQEIGNLLHGKQFISHAQGSSAFVPSRFS